MDSERSTMSAMWLFLSPKINPFLWVSRPSNQYWSFGKPLGAAFIIGKEIKP